MIYFVVIFLVVALLLLFVDWQGILGRFSERRASRPQKVGAGRSTAEPARFDFDLDLPTEATPYQAPALPVEEKPARPLDSEVEKMLAEADIHFRKGEMKAAEDFYLQAAAKDPRCSKAYSRLGVIYLENGDNWSDAEEAFRQALKFDQENGFILNNLGLVLYHQDKYADAIRHFEQAVRQDDLNAARHANLGMGYMAIRQYAKAESSFKKALKLAPQELEYKDLLNEAIEKKNAHKTMVRR